MDNWINWMVGEVFKFDNSVLAYHSPVAAAEVDKRKLTLFRQMIEFVVFAWDKLIRAPYFALRWVYKGLVQIANAVFQGGDRGASIIPVPEEKMDKRDQLVLAKLASVTETKMKADAALASPVTPSHVKSTPELWSKVRKLIFGMLDGSNLETFGVPKSENGWPVIYRVSSIFNDPSKRTQILNPETLSPEAPLELSWEELARYPELQKAFTGKRASVDGENLKSLTKLVKLNEDVEAKKLRLTALKDHLEEIQPSDKDEADLQEEDATAAKDQTKKVVAE
jgi:hypothetical protein